LLVVSSKAFPDLFIVVENNSPFWIASSKILETPISAQFPELKAWRTLSTLIPKFSESFNNSSKWVLNFSNSSSFVKPEFLRISYCYFKTLALSTKVPNAVLVFEKF